MVMGLAESSRMTIRASPALMFSRLRPAIRKEDKRRKVPETRPTVVPVAPCLYIGISHRAISVLPCAGLLSNVAICRPRGRGCLPRSGRSTGDMPPPKDTTPHGHIPRRGENVPRWPPTKNVAPASDKICRARRSTKCCQCMKLNGTD